MSEVWERRERTSGSRRGSRRCRTSSSSVLASAPGERVLDLATGTGEVAIRAARAGATVTAIDIAEPMLEKARAARRGGGRRRRVRPRRRRVPARTTTRASTCVALELRPHLRARPRERRRRARARRRARRPARLHRVEAEPEARRALPPLHRGADRGPRGLRVGPRGPRRGHARRGLRARVRGRHALARGRLGRGDLEALLGVGAAGDRARSSGSTPSRREEFHRAFVELYESYRDGRRRIRARPRRYLLVLGRRK